MKILQIFCSILSLIIAGVIYIFFRDKSLLVFKWLSFFDFSKNLLGFRGYINYYFPIKYNWILFVLPDGLWMFSCTTLWLLLKFQIEGNEKFLILLIPFSGIILELGQKYNLIYGTFDIFDILAYIIGFGFSILFFSCRVFNIFNSILTFRWVFVKNSKEKH